MNDVEKSLKMYESMASRCAKTGLSPKQAEAYEKLIVFLSECKSGEEMMQKLKDNPIYYENVAKGLVLDKLFALEKAAKENGYTELEKIYNERYLEVEKDYSKAYVMGYEKKVNDFHRSHLEDIRYFVDTFINYIEYKGAYPDEKHFEDIKANYNALIKKGHEFKKLSGIEEFRKSIMLCDDEYNKYIMDVEELVKTSFDDSENTKKYQEIFDKAWSVLKDKESIVKEIGRKEGAKTYRAAFMVIPPDDENGRYEFEMEEREEME